MKFTIESFKTHIYRPAEWMIENDKISHLIVDLTKQYLNERFCSYSDADGETFKITVSSDVCVDENEILTVKFLNVTSGKYVKETHERYNHYNREGTLDDDKKEIKLASNFIYDKVVFEDNFEVLVSKTNLPYWTAATLLKKINALVFKVITEMQEYEDKSRIVVDPEDTETK